MTVATPLVQAVTEYTELTGTLVAVKTADVRGYIQAVLIEEGTEVKAGQKLFHLGPRPFEAALGQAEARGQSAQAKLVEATATETRPGKVRQTGAVSAEEYEQARAAAARADVTAVEAAVRQAQLSLDYTSVEAPFDGRIDRVLVNEGNVVTGGTGQGTILTRVVTVDPIYASFTVNEQAVLAYLRRMVREGRVPSKGGGLSVEVRLSDEIRYTHKRTIDFTKSGLGPTTGSLQLRQGRVVLADRHVRAGHRPEHGPGARPEPRASNRRPRCCPRRCSGRASSSAGGRRTS